VTGRVSWFLVLLTVLSVACTDLQSASHGRVFGRTAASATVVGKINWSSCGGGFQCGTLSVPLDYSRPQYRAISLSLIRKRARNQSQRIGSVLVNPGGPGGSGVDFLRSAASIFTYLNTFFDLVSWDPRGVGESAPVTCEDGPQLDSYMAIDSVLDDPQEKQQFIKAVENFTSSCARRSGDLLPFMDTASTARDIERIRDAVGDKKLTYLGFSYGTFIGQWYAHLFPTHVRALVFDGVVDSTSSNDQSVTDQVDGFQKNLDAFFASCKTDTRCTYGRAGDPAAKLATAVEKLDKTPLQLGSRQLTRSMAIRGVLSTLYDEAAWPDLDAALTALDKGDGSYLLELADYFDGRNSDGTYANEVNGGNQATACLDAFSPSDISAYDRAGPELAQASPLFGPWTQYSGLECAYWPVKGKYVNERLTVAGAPPILLVGGTNDPATPYAEAQSVSSQIPNSVLLTRKGNGHTSYASSTCAQAAEDKYMIDLTLPTPGTVCVS